MTQQADPAPLDPQNPIHTWGLWAVISGAVSLILVFVFIVQPFAEPAPPVGTQIGEIAGDMTRSAWRSFLGLEREVVAVEPPTTSLNDILAIAAPALGALAIVLAMISGIKREDRRYVVYGTGFGVSAILSFYLWWVALLICGVMLLIAIIENPASFFSFGLWD